MLICNDGFGMIEDFVPSLFLVAFVGVFVYVTNRKDSDETHDNWKEMFGPMGFQVLILTLILMWIFPGGILFIGPILLVLSILSPAGRIAWKEYRQPRSIVSLGLVVMIFLGGFTPVSEPTSPSEWGPPLFTENPNAPFYPSGEQYTWLMLPESGGLDIEIVQSLRLRLPYQYGPIGAEYSALTIASLLNMEQGRLSQAIELLDDELSGFRLEVEDMILEPIMAEETHRYSSTSAGVDLDVNVRLYELRSLSVGSTEDGLKVGEVLCLVTGNWGGTLDVLVIVRPIGHPGLVADRFAESYALEWLAT